MTYTLLITLSYTGPIIRKFVHNTFIYTYIYIIYLSEYMYDWYIMILWQPNFIPLRPVLAYDTTWNGVSADGILGRVCVGMGEAVRVCPEIKGGCCLRDCMEGGQCVDNIVCPQLWMTRSGPVEAQWGYHPLTTQRGFLFCVFVIWRNLCKWSLVVYSLRREVVNQPCMITVWYDLGMWAT